MSCFLFVLLLPTSHAVNISCPLHFLSTLHFALSKPRSCVTSKQIWELSSPPLSSSQELRHMFESLKRGQGSGEVIYSLGRTQEGAFMWLTSFHLHLLRIASLGFIFHLCCHSRGNSTYLLPLGNMCLASPKENVKKRNSVTILSSYISFLNKRHNVAFFSDCLYT